MAEPRTRLLVAMLLYAAFAVMAALTLDGKFRIAVWLLMVAFALRTWIAAKRQS
jgi:hypothetical protein